MSNELEKELLQGIKLGDSAEKLVDSPIGKFLIERAQEDALDAMNTLKTISPIETEHIRALQNRIQCAENFETWLMEAIQIGHMSQEQIELIDSPD